MKSFTKTLWSHNSAELGKRQYSGEICKSNPKLVETFPDLVKEIAVISSNNPDVNLLFRGQRREHKIKNRGTALYPSIFRKKDNARVRDVLKSRYDFLARASKELTNVFGEKKWQGKSTLEKFPEICWAILQHYEFCETPLLDVTSSLRVACSFALRKANENAILYVLGFPHTNGSISYYADEELLIVRLLSICPPNALRPYFQDGYLVGTFPTTVVLSRTPRLDVARRLVAKYRIHKNTFWDRDFPEIPQRALFLEPDEVEKVIAQLKLNNKN